MNRTSLRRNYAAVVGMYNWDISGRGIYYLQINFWRGGEGSMKGPQSERELN